ncbi:cytochrome c biogenesis protein [Caldibacillus lycopersici]|uniref:Cytochrome c biogenesis protein n=1 Tax=Perspicuibacillus lycopersici TaxID=1325689 RepID=A0AAE3LTI5_9BACI|nr:cytochrome c biogenesis protein [Perspicuibacillus lycopersici]MCU9614038.1 cytochrome c biogenesis protein [Perspicuibacillus lycopersici]
MGEQILAKMHEGIVLLYAFSVLLYFVDFLHHNRKANRIAFWLLSIVWLLQTFFLLFYMYDKGRFPILTLSEGLYFYVWVLITLSLAINRFLRVDFFVFFTNVLAFLLLVIYTFAPFHWQSNVLAEKLASELLIIHIIISLLAYGAFTLSFIFSLLYLIQYDLLKQKKWGKRLIRIGNLAKLEQLAYILNVIGVPLLLSGVILGLQWAYIKIPDLVFYDWKIIGSCFVLIVYGIYLYMKIRKEMMGRNLAFLNIAAFLIVLINFFLLGKLSLFHIWYY